MAKKLRDAESTLKFCVDRIGEAKFMEEMNLSKTRYDMINSDCQIMMACEVRQLSKILNGLNNPIEPGTLFVEYGFGFKEVSLHDAMRLLGSREFTIKETNKQVVFRFLK
jgi:hypothetical protein